MRLAISLDFTLKSGYDAPTEIVAIQPKRPLQKNWWLMEPGQQILLLTIFEKWKRNQQKEQV